MKRRSEEPAAENDAAVAAIGDPFQERGRDRVVVQDGPDGWGNSRPARTTPGTLKSASTDRACHARSVGPSHRIPNRTGREGIAVRAPSDILVETRSRDYLAYSGESQLRPAADAGRVRAWADSWKPFGSRSSPRRSHLRS